MHHDELNKKIQAFTARRLGVVLDDIGFPTRGILVSPAQDCTSEIMNRIITLSSGLPFVAIPANRAAAFMLEEMARPRSQPFNAGAAETGSALKTCVSVEARERVSTGISAADRATTVAILGEVQPSPRKLVKPGHIFPVEAKDGGVLVKPALAEAALDLVTSSGFTPAALFLDLLTDEGGLVSKEFAQRLCSTEDLPFFNLTEVIEYRLRSESLVERVAEAKLPTKLAGELRTIAYRSRIHSGEHLALVKGEILPDVPVLTRVQPEFTLSDVFGGTTPASRTQLHRSLEEIGRRGSGVLLYLRRSRHGELKEQVVPSAASLNMGSATIMREYGIGAQILRDLGVRKIELLTSTTRNLVGLDSFGIEIVAQHPIPT